VAHPEKPGSKYCQGADNHDSYYKMLSALALQRASFPAGFERQAGIVMELCASPCVAALLSMPCSLGGLVKRSTCGNRKQVCLVAERRVQIFIQTKPARVNTAGLLVVTSLRSASYMRMAGTPCGVRLRVIIIVSACGHRHSCVSVVYPRLIQILLHPYRLSESNSIPQLWLFSFYDTVLLLACEIGFFDS
jgi:hypothetical protein